jgi:hypothetical protein
MDGKTNHLTAVLGQRSITHEIPEADRGSELEINVVFTDTESTLAALRLAGDLACNLGARIHLLVPHLVPLYFPLTRPPVSIPFTQRGLLELAQRGTQGTLETAIHLYLCRDKQQVLFRVLPPKSLVIVGEKKRWWPTKESKLARMLQSQGHQVILAPSGVRNHARHILHSGRYRFFRRFLVFHQGL